MFYAHYVDVSGQEHSDLLDDWDQFYKDTFGPDADIFSIIDFHLHGKNYADRQAWLCDIARRFQYECAPGLSMLELSWISDWFYKNGKRYGLLREFRENCIC